MNGSLGNSWLASRKLAIVVGRQSRLASLAHLHGRVYLVVSCVLFVERGDQVEEVVEDRGDGGRGNVRG